MRITKANKKALTYACKQYHYTGSPGTYQLGYNIYNNDDEWCGCILYAFGANPHIASNYNYNNGEVMELTRMCLNGKQEYTSQALGLTLKQIKKDVPNLKLLVSYADKGQGHQGTIYKATNWYLVEETDSSGLDYFYKGKWTHARMVSNIDKSKLKKRNKPGKYKFLYPLDKKARKMCEELKINI